MTNYDDATAPRRTPPQVSDRAPQPAPGHRPRRSHVIEGEVVAAEVPDAQPADRPSPGRAGQRPTADAPPPAAPARTELQHSLDKIERLAAELKDIAEVITPTPTAGTRRSPGAQPARAPLAERPVDAPQAEPPAQHADRTPSAQAPVGGRGPQGAQVARHAQRATPPGPTAPAPTGQAAPAPTGQPAPAPTGQPAPAPTGEP